VRACVSAPSLSPADAVSGHEEAGVWGTPPLAPRTASCSPT